MSGIFGNEVADGALPCYLFLGPFFTHCQVLLYSKHLQVNYIGPSVFFLPLFPQEYFRFISFLATQYSVYHLRLVLRFPSLRRDGTGTVIIGLQSFKTLGIHYLDTILSHRSFTVHDFLLNIIRKSVDNTDQHLMVKNSYPSRDFFLLPYLS